MSELTKEYFEQTLDKKLDQKLDQKLDEKLDEKLKNFVTVQILDEKLTAQTKELKAYASEQTEELAQMVKAGFDSVDRQCSALEQKLDVRGTVFTLEKRITKIEGNLGFNKNPSG